MKGLLCSWCLDQINPDESFLFRPKARSKSIPIQNIRYDKQKYRELFDECVEGYVLQQLNKGYKIVYRYQLPFILNCGDL